MAADVELRQLSGIVRAGRHFVSAAEAKAGGKMYETALPFYFDGETVEIVGKGRDDIMTGDIARMIGLALLEIGAKHVTWDRYQKGKHKRVTFELSRLLKE